MKNRIFNKKKKYMYAKTATVVSGFSFFTICKKFIKNNILHVGEKTTAHTLSKRNADIG